MIDLQLAEVRDVRSATHVAVDPLHGDHPHLSDMILW